MFDGFPFMPKNPYTYLEARRLLKLAMGELRKDRSLRALGVDTKAPGKGAIKGRTASSVWDILRLAGHPKGTDFTNYPHLSLLVGEHRLGVGVVIPNSVIRPVRQRLAALEPKDWIALNAKILHRAKRILRRSSVSIWATASQRHFEGRSLGVQDAQLEFKLETSQPRGQGRVKHQLQWVTQFSELLREKRSNIQFGYSVRLPWGTKGIDSRDSLRMIVESWRVLKPLLDVVTARTRR